MGARGPAPTSPDILHMRGTFRPDRHSGEEVKSPVLAKVPSAPKHLADRAKKIWRQKAKMLIGIGMLTEADLASLEGYCLAHERAIEAEEAVRLCPTGRMMATAEGFKRHPELITAEKARADMRRYEVEFGLTPAARARLRVPVKKEKPVGNPFGAVAAGAARKRA